MCEKCTPYDAKIAKYQRLSFRINDRQTLDAIAVLIAQAIETKGRHPSSHIERVRPPRLAALSQHPGPIWQPPRGSPFRPRLKV